MYLAILLWLHSNGINMGTSPFTRECGWPRLKHAAEKIPSSARVLLFCTTLNSSSYPKEGSWSNLTRQKRQLATENRQDSTHTHILVISILLVKRTSANKPCFLPTNMMYSHIYKEICVRNPPKTWGITTFKLVRSRVQIVPNKHLPSLL